MNITDLDSLKAAVLRWAGRVGEEDIEAELDTIVQLGETRINRELRIDDMLREILYDATDGDSMDHIRLPDDFNALGKLQVDGFSWEWRPHDELSRLGRSPHAGRIPGFYSIIGRELHLLPVVSGKATLTYYRRMPALHTLETGRQTHSLLQSHPDLYLYASLTQLIIFDRSYEEASTWEGQYQRVLGETQLQNRRSRYPQDQPIQSSVGRRGRRQNA